MKRMFTSATLKTNRLVFTPFYGNHFALLFSFIIFELSTSEISSWPRAAASPARNKQPHHHITRATYINRYPHEPNKAGQNEYFIGLVYMNIAVISIMGRNISVGSANVAGQSKKRTNPKPDLRRMPAMSYARL